MLIEKFFKNSLIYTISTFLSRGINFLLLPFYTRLLTPSDYGVFDFFSLIGLLMCLSLPLEITQGVARYYHESNNEDDKRLYASTSLWFTLFVYFVFILICLLFSEQISSFILPKNNAILIFYLAVFNTVFNGVFYLFQNQLKWELRARDSLYLSQIYTFTNILFSLILVYNYKLVGLFLAQILAFSISCFFGFLFLKKSYSEKFSWKHCQEMLSYSLPLVPSGLAIFFALSIDRLAIKDLLSFTEVGLYGVGARFATVVSLLISSIQSSLNPLIFQAHQAPNTRIELDKLFRLFIFGSLLFINFLTLFSFELFSVFIASEFYAAVYIIPVLASAIIFSNIYLFFPGLALEKKTMYISFLSIANAVMNTSLNYILIPIMGFYGAALATCMSGAFCAIFYFRWSQTYYALPYKWKPIFLSMILSLLLIFYIKLYFDVFALNYYFVVIKLAFLSILTILNLFLLSTIDELRVLAFILRAKFD